MNYPNLGFGGFGMSAATQNQAQAIGNQFGQQLTQSVLPGIGADAQFAGGFGGSRQGVAEGNAIQGMSQSLGNSLANLYGNAYGQDQNFYTQQRGQDLQQQQVGSNMFNMGVAGNLGIGQGNYNVGQQYMNAPVNAAQSFGSTIQPFSGLGSTTTSSGQQNSNPWAGALGGAILGGQMWNNVFK